MERIIAILKILGLALFIIIFAIGFILLGCSIYLSKPRLTPEDRKRDVEYLAQWAKYYSPFVELNEKLKDVPSYEALKPKYVEWAIHAKDNIEFVQIIHGYASLIGASGHSYIFRGNDRKWFFGSKPAYWHKLFYEHSIAYPPFLLTKMGSEYITQTDYMSDNTHIPKGSKVLAVNGMTCQAYLEYIKRNTCVRYVADRTENLDRRLLLVNEGRDFRGWEISFQLPDQTTVSCFVPVSKGKGPPKTDFYDVSKGNCICLALTEDVGYIRIKSFALRHAEPDSRAISSFLEQSAGNFTKLIIDVRHNPGGRTEYFYETLIKPFLNQPVSYKHVVGMKRKFLEDHNQAYIDGQRFTVSSWANETDIIEVSPPPEFSCQEWVFYEITRQLSPNNQYDFHGDIFVLINEKTGSAADDFANAMKRIGMSTLVGRNTFGSAAAYVAPVAVRLPESGMEFIMEVDLLINPDGSYNEIVGTSPDIILPSGQLPETVTKEALLNDDWISKIIRDL